MKTTIISLTALVLTCTGAHAQSAWDGADVGITLSANVGDQDYCPCDNNSGIYGMTGNTGGLFAGYNYNAGSFVLGGEIAVTAGTVYEESVSSDDVYEEYDFEQFIDIKGRAGYDLGQVMAYGVLGYSIAEWSQDGVKSDSTGILFGAGVDYAITDQFIVGAELVSRSLTNDTEDFEATINSLSLRGSYKF